MKIIHLTYDIHDPISHILIKEKRENVIHITLADFIETVKVLDYIDSESCHIYWEFEKEKIINDHHTLLLSRVCYIPPELFVGYKAEDREYALAEFEAYLGFALNAFHGVNRKIDENGCIPCHSLPFQWHLVNKHIKKLTTPQYYWGDFRFNHLAGEDLLYSDIYQYDLWNNQLRPDANVSSIFCIKRPMGVAVVSLVINDKVLISNMMDESISEQVKKHISILSLKIAVIFEYFICEILFFIQDSKIIFGCVSPFIIQSDKSCETALFENFVVTSIFEGIHGDERYLHS